MANPPPTFQNNPDGIVYPGTPCKHGGDCSSGQKCAYPGTDHSHKICCPFGQYHKDALGKPYCKDLPPGYFCASGGGCKNGACGHPQGSSSTQTICCYFGQTAYMKSRARFFCTNQPQGSVCNNDIECASRNCDSGICALPRRGFFGELGQIFIYGFVAIFVVIIIILIFKFA